MAQAQSRLVACEFCTAIVRARGLHGHMRLKHHIFVKTIKVSLLNSSLDSAKQYINHLDTGPNVGSDSEKKSQQIEPTRDIKPENDLAESENKSRWSKYALSSYYDGCNKPTFRNCYRCNNEIELKCERAWEYSYANHPEIHFVCENCITTFYDDRSSSGGCFIRGTKFDAWGVPLHSRKISER